MDTGTKQHSENSKTIDPVISEGKLFAAVGYLSILCFIPLFLKKDNAFAQFHGRQALILFVLELAAAMLMIIPVVGEVVFRFAYLVFSIFSLAGLVKVLMNEYWEMPIIYPISSRVTL